MMFACAHVGVEGVVAFQSLKEEMLKGQKGCESLHRKATPRWGDTET